MARAFTQNEVKLIRKMLGDRKSGLRDLALFNTGISTMLRTSDLLNLKMSDVWAEKIQKDFSVRMKKTGRPVTVLLDEYSQTSLTEWIYESKKERGDWLFTWSDLVKNGNKVNLSPGPFWSGSASLNLLITQLQSDGTLINSPIITYGLNVESNTPIGIVAPARRYVEGF